MREVYYFTKRNCLIFFRDREAVFFSVFSMLIVLALMVLFQGRMNSGTLIRLLDEFGGAGDVQQDRKNAEYLIWLLTLAGMLAVNSVTVTMTVMGAAVRDETQKRLQAFYITPVKRLRLALGYIISAWLAGTVLCMLTLLAGEIYFLLCGNGLLAGVTMAKLCGMVGANVLTWSAVSYFLALFVHSDSAWGGILTVVGTLVGFAAGIYIPMGSLPERVQTVLKCIPVLHGASMLRETAAAAALEDVFAGLPQQAAELFRQEMGVSVYLGEHCFSVWEQLAILAAYAIMALAAAALLGRHRRLKDR